MPLTRAQRESMKPISQPNQGKRKTEGRTILGDLSNKVGLLRNSKLTTLKNQANSNLRKKPLEAKQKPEDTKETLQKQTCFTGHDLFMTNPLDVWRDEIRENLQTKGAFYDQEANVGHFDSPDYAMGFFEYMKWREERFEIKQYLPMTITKTDGEKLQQSTFCINDRREIIDWMVEFQELTETNHETLYMAVRLCDYYFSRVKVPKSKLQLYACVGFLLASKFEERWPPTLEELGHYTHDSYEPEEFMVGELQMLKVLDFDINIPISYRYLRRYAKCIGMDMKALTLARFFLEISLLEYQFVTENQSKMAAAVLWIAMQCLGYEVSERRQVQPVRYRKKYWCNLLSYYTGLHEWEIVGLAKRIATVVKKNRLLCQDFALDDDEERFDENGVVICQTVYRKYASETFFEVAKSELPSEEDFVYHELRCNTEQVDYEAIQEPAVKRRSSNCTSRLQQELTQITI